MGNVFVDFLLNKGLYDEIEITEDNFDNLVELINGKVPIKCYCKECEEESVFSMNPIYAFEFDNMRGWDAFPIAQKLRINQNDIRFAMNPAQFQGKTNMEVWKEERPKDYTRVMVFKYVCELNSRHSLDFVVCTNDEMFKKIGQYPSVADLEFPELNQYRKVLCKEDLSDMKRAIGLHAQGIGAGSYVYLRRILEHLIDNAKNKAVEDISSQFDIDIYNKSKVQERIKMLKMYLPDTLTNNTQIYGIVSKGIHELSEEECIQYFPVLKSCIFMILEKWEEARKKAKNEKELTKALTEISTNLSK